MKNWVKRNFTNIVLLIIVLLLISLVSEMKSINQVILARQLKDSDYMASMSAQMDSLSNQWKAERIQLNNLKNYCLNKGDMMDSYVINKGRVDPHLKEIDRIFRKGLK